MKSEYLKSLLYVVFGLFPVDKNKVFFSSFRGMYNDNPKVISEKLHSINPKLRIIWEKSEKARDSFPDYAEVVNHNSIIQIYHYATSYITVENGSGYFCTMWKSRFSWLRKYYKNPKSIDIATWHGTPFKHIGLDIPEHKVNNASISTSADFIIAGSEFEAKVFKQAFRETIKIMKLGNPRNDVLFKNNANRYSICNKLGIPGNMKIVLYCPTFRDNLKDSGVVQLGLIRIKDLLKALAVKFGGEWVFVFRAHQKVMLEIPHELKQHEYINGNIGDDMADYLSVSDCLITDYSGSIFDWCFTNKPCFLFAHDRDAYSNNERGLYLNLDELPFSFSETFDDLLEQIDKYDSSNSVVLRNVFLRKLGNINKGHAADDIAHWINTLID